MSVIFRGLALFTALLALSFSSFGQVRGAIGNLDEPTPVRPTTIGNIGSIESGLNENGEVSIGGVSCGGGITGDGIPKTPLEIMHFKVCAASAIVAGTAVSKQSRLDSDGSWIITDYAIRVEKVFKNDTRYAIKRGEDVIVTMSGGQISINGKIATAKDNDYAFLNSADLYIFFLNRTPMNGTYIPVMGSGFISAADGSLYSLRAQPHGSDQTSIGYLDLISSASKIPCVSKQK